jgi:two-component system, chemotaxis family, protein-glutamate methylesterase/glutaminase
MPNRNLVVIGGSAGAIEAVREILRRLPGELPAAICVVIHSSPDGPSLLPQVLGRSSNLPTAFARHDEPIETGRVYIAPPDQHLLVSNGRLHLTRGPRENGFRPAVDPLFRSAASARRSGVLSVIVSGALNDGTYGAMLVKRAGGLVIVQDVQDALVASMPRSVLDNVAVDYSLPCAEIGPLLNRLVREPAIGGGAMSPIEENSEPAEGQNRGVHPQGVNGPPSPYTCPDCGGALWELQNGELLRYQCHIGHGYTAETLAVDQEYRFETAMWTAARVLEQTASLHRRMAERADRGNLAGVAADYRRRADEADEQGDLLREALLKFREPRLPPAPQRAG